MHHRHHLSKLTTTKLFQTIYTVLYMYTHTASVKKIGTLVKQSTYVSVSHCFFVIMT